MTRTPSLTFQLLREKSTPVWSIHLVAESSNSRPWSARVEYVVAGFPNRAVVRCRSAVVVAVARTFVPNHSEPTNLGGQVLVADVVCVHVVHVDPRTGRDGAAADGQVTRQHLVVLLGERPHVLVALESAVDHRGRRLVEELEGRTSGASTETVAIRPHGRRCVYCSAGTVARSVRFTVLPFQETRCVCVRTRCGQPLKAVSTRAWSAVGAVGASGQRCGDQR